MFHLCMDNNLYILRDSDMDHQSFHSWKSNEIFQSHIRSLHGVCKIHIDCMILAFVHHHQLAQLLICVQNQVVMSQYHSLAN